MTLKITEYQFKFLNVTGFGALGGNLVVIFLMVRTLRNLNLSRSETDKKNEILNALMILNLAVSDLLVSVSQACSCYLR